MPGRMPDLEQHCIEILGLALRQGMKDTGVEMLRDDVVEDGIPTLTIHGEDGTPLIQIVVIATNLTPHDGTEQEQPCPA